MVAWNWAAIKTFLDTWGIYVLIAIFLLILLLWMRKRKKIINYKSKLDLDNDKKDTLEYIEEELGLALERISIINKKLLAMRADLINNHKNIKNNVSIIDGHLKTIGKINYEKD